MSKHINDTDIAQIKATSAWDLLGNIGVDTGQIVVGDPAYVEEALADLTVTFVSGYGDGIYPVYGRKNEEGRLVEVRILMDFAERNAVPA